MVIGFVVAIWLLGLVLWLAPFTGWAVRLNEVGKWTFIIAFAVWLGLGR